MIKCLFVPQGKKKDLGIKKVLLTLKRSKIKTTSSYIKKTIAAIIQTISDGFLIIMFFIL